MMILRKNLFLKIKERLVDMIAGKHTGTVITVSKSRKIFAFSIGLVIIYAAIFSAVGVGRRDFDIAATPIGEDIEMSENLSVTPEKILFSAGQQQLELYLSIDDLYTGYTSEFEISAYLRAEKVSLLPTAIAAKNDEILVVKISEVPADFQAVRLDLVPVEDTAGKTESAKIYCTNSSVTRVLEFKETTEKEFLTVYYNFKIEQINEKISEAESTIAGLQKTIEKNNEVIKKIDETIPLLEETDAAPARAQRRQKQTENENLNKQIESENAKITTLNNKQVSLKKRFEAA